MSHVRDTSVQRAFARAVARHGVNKVARVTDFSRATTMSIALGTCREGTEALAEQRIGLLAALDILKGERVA